MKKLILVISFLLSVSIANARITGMMSLPDGETGDIQFNFDGLFGGVSDMNYDTATETLTVTRGEFVTFLKVPHGASLIAGDCVGDDDRGKLFIWTDAGSGQQLYACEGSAGWVVQGDGYNLPSAGASDLAVADGGVVVSSPTAILNFQGDQFNITQTPTGQANVSVNPSSVTVLGNMIGDANISDTLTIGPSSTVDDGALSANVALLNSTQTITANWVNTLHPWADNEVSDTLTIGSASTIDDGALSANVPLFDEAGVITANWDNSTHPWVDNEVSDTLTIGSGSTVDDGALSANVALMDGDNVFTGTNTFSNPWNVFAGDGSALTGLDAASIETGTLNAGRLPVDGYASTYVNVDGDTMTGDLIVSGSTITVVDGGIIISTTTGSFGITFQDGTVQTTAGGGGGASELSDLTDVDTTGVADGNVLVYDDDTSTWLPGVAAGGGASTLQVSEGGVEVSSPTATINFSSHTFTLNESPAGVANVEVNSSSVTLQGNVFNTANSLLQLDGSGLVPNSSLDVSSVTLLGPTINANELPADGYASTYVNVTGDTMTGGLTVQSDIYIDSQVMGPTIFGLRLEHIGNPTGFIGYKSYDTLNQFVQLTNPRGFVWAGTSNSGFREYFKIREFHGRTGSSVGINNVLPTVSLDVKGESNFAGMMTINSNGITVPNDCVVSQILFYTSGGSQSHNIRVYTYDDIGGERIYSSNYCTYTSTPTDVSGSVMYWRIDSSQPRKYRILKYDSNLGYNYDRYLDTDTESLTFGYGLTDTFASSWTAGDTVTPTTGNLPSLATTNKVGIGTNTPATLLHVSSGTVRIDGTSPALAIAEGSDTLTMTVPALTANRSVTLPDAAGEVSLLGQSIQVAEIDASGSPSASNFLRGDGSWSAPAGSGDAVLAATQTWTGGNTFNSWSVFGGSATFNDTLSIAVGDLNIPGGSSGQQLTTNGSGALSWADAGSGGGTPGGSNTQVQFNNSGSFGGSSNFTWASNTLTLSNPDGIALQATCERTSPSNQCYALYGWKTGETSADSAGVIGYADTGAQGIYGVGADQETHAARFYKVAVNTSGWEPTVRIHSNQATGLQLLVEGPTELDGNLTIGSSTVTINTVPYYWPSGDGANGQQLTTDGSGNLSWAAAGASGGDGTMTTVKEGGSQVGGADIVTLDFDGNQFDLSETPDTEINISLNVSSVTLQGNTFNAANRLVQLDGSGGLPALNGAALTSLTAANISAGSLGASVIASSIAVNSVGTAQIANSAVTAAKMANADHGDVSWSGGVATVDNVAAANIAAGALGSSVRASSITVAAVGIPQINATGTAGTTTYLRGDGSWTTPPTGGDAYLGNTQSWTGTNTHTAPVILDDTSLQIQEGADTLTITVPTLTAARAVTFPDAAGEISLLGQTIDLAAEVTGTLPVGSGGTGATTLTDGGILLGSGTGAITPMAVLGDGAIVVGDGTTDPVALTAFTSATGDLIHEAGGLEADVSAYTGLLAISGGATSEVDSKAELEAQIADVSDFAMADGDVFSGVHDFGGATSLEIPNGTAPTVDATGEIAVDTTRDQIVYYGASSVSVVEPVHFKSVVISSPTASTRALLALMPYAITVRSINGIVDPADSSESVVFALYESNSSGDFTDLATNGLDGTTTITADNDGTNDDGTLSNPSIDAGDWIGIDIGTVTGTVSHLTVTFTYTVDRQ